MLKHNARLLKRHAGKPLNELMDGSVVFEVLEERCHRHARASKDPRTANASGIALDGSAGGPIDHGEMVALGVLVTFDMSGGWKRAKHAGKRPLDGLAE